MPDDEHAYRKAVVDSERWFLAHPPDRSPVVQIVLAGHGAIDLDALRAAVAVASAANPGVRVVRRGGWWIDGGASPAVRCCTRPAGGELTDLPELHDPLPDRHDRSCEVLYCPGRPTAVVFRGSHAVLDGTGLSMWAVDVMRALRGEEPVGARATCTQDEVIDLLGLPDATTAQRPDRPSPVGPPSRGPRRTLWRRRTLDGHHPALAAKVATALTDIYGLDSGRFMIAFDLRRHVPELRSTGNLAQSELYQVPAGQSWPELHERLLTAMAAGREIEGRVSSPLLRLPLPLLRGMIRATDGRPNNRYPASSLLSNMGQVDLAALAGPDFVPETLYPLSTLTALSPPDVNTVQCGGRTEITMTWCHGPGNADRMDAVLDALVERLAPRSARVLLGPVRDEPAGSVVAEFAAAVDRYPDEPAVRWPGGRLSYAELDRLSAAVAHQLRHAGVERGSLVGIVAERTPEVVAGIWGVLRAGAAYLPLDPQHPDARVAALLDDAGVPLCLAGKAHRDRSLTPPGCRVLDLPDAGEPVPSAPPLPDPPRPDDLAYVSYTSGSTGTPKGVEIRHRSLVNYLRWARREFDVGPGSSFGVFSSLAFDLAGTALHTPLVSGGAVTLVPDEPNHLSLRYLVTESGATALKLTPSHLELIDRLGLQPRGIRLLVVGGEALRRSVAERALRRFGPDCRLVDHYGPTEATIGCLTHEFDPATDTGTVVPIGRPRDNCTAHLVGPDGRFVPPGEPGELYLGGAQLARGYRGRPDLDRDRFVRFADGTRVYRTGDLARLLPTGDIEFIGRADDQVKIAGHRVEPAEITHAAETHPGVAAAATVARADSPGSAKQLHTYLVPARPSATAAAENASARDSATAAAENASARDSAASAAESASAGELDLADVRRHLAARLPRQLLPASLTVVESIPYTTNGKVDAAALPRPDRSGRREPLPPADPTIAAVGAIWAEILSVPVAEIESDTDFHRLGGDSVLLLSMLAAVSRTLVGAEAESGFMAHLGGIVRDPTPGRIADAVRLAGAAG